MGSNVSEDNIATFFRVEMKMEAVCFFETKVTGPILGDDNMGHICLQN
jgi:hypothetical protein